MTHDRTPTKVAPASLVIFGITGDLVNRKLLPALYDLARYDMLPKPFKIIGVTRSGTTVKTLLDTTRANVEKAGHTCDEAVLLRIGQMLQVVTMDLVNPDDYKKLKQQLDAIEAEAGVCMNRLYYLAIPAQMFGHIVKHLGQSGLNQACPHKTGTSRLLVEKPFGYDLASAHELIAELDEHFSEEQVYRIDHYLAKETAQNILTFRFDNPLFKTIWNSKSISRITITAAEKLDIEGRATFYEQTGALRDLIQSHLLQLLALTTMDEPGQLTAQEIHKQKQTLLDSIAPIAPNEVADKTIRGQYDGYRQEVGDPHTVTETYAAIRLAINNPRWQGTEVILQTGKALAEKVIEIELVFTDTDKNTNRLTIRVQPNEGISLELLAKKPGFEKQVEPVHMEFDYKRSFGDKKHPDAYERVLSDAFKGDKTLFATSHEVLASWKIIDAVVHEWAKNDTGLSPYKKGTSGPMKTF